MNLAVLLVVLIAMAAKSNGAVQLIAGKKVLLYVLCYSSKSCRVADKYFSRKHWAKRVRLPSTVFFETDVFVNHFPRLMAKDLWTQYDYVGTISWKAHIKFSMAFNFGMFNLTDIIASAPENVDVIGFVGQAKGKAVSMLLEAKKVHKRFEEIWTGLLDAFSTYTPEQISTNGMIPFYCNYFLAKPQHMVRFLPFIKQAQNYLQHLPSIQEALWSDPKYTVGKATVAKAVFNRTVYAYHPFILERLTPFFFNVENRSIYVYKKFSIVAEIKSKRQQNIPTETT